MNTQKQEKISTENSEEENHYSFTRKNISILILSIVVINIIFLIGLMAIADFNEVLTNRYGADSVQPLYKQILFFVVGLIFMIIVMKYAKFIHKIKWILFGLAILLLIISLLKWPYYGQYIYLGGIHLHSGIWAVLLSMPLFSHLFNIITHKPSKVINYIYLILFLSLINILLLLQKEISLCILLTFIILLNLFLTKIVIIRKIWLSIILLIPFFIMIFFNSNHRKQLQIDFHQLITENKIINSNRTYFEFFSKIEQNGLTGNGFGHYKNKELIANRLTENILFVTGWQLGILGIIVVVVLYGLLLKFMMYAVRKIKNPPDKALAFTIFLFFGFQVIFGLLQNFDLFPIALRYGMPLMSFNGTTIIVHLIALGAVLSGLLPKDLSSINE